MTHTVLLVDDNSDLIALLTESLAKIGDFAISSAHDGLSGLERSIELRPDCIVIDVLMPQLDGYQLVRALRGDPFTAHIPLVILTALAQEKDRFAGLAAGADQYLVKPVGLRDLVSAIEQAIATTQAERVRRLNDLTDKTEGEQEENG